MDVQGFLADLRRRLRRVLLLDGVATLVVMLLGGLVLAVVLDWVWTVPSVVRLGLLLALAVGVATATARRLVRPLGRIMDDRALANLAERRLPELDGRLLTQVDGIDLGEADRRQLFERLGNGTVAALVPAPALPGRMLLAVATLVVATLLVVLSPQTAQDGLRRLLLPFGGTEWERSSRLSGELDAPVVAEDQPVVVRLRREAGPAAPMQLSWSSLKTPAVRESRMLSGLTGPWSQALNLPPGEYVLRAESGDARPVELRALVVRRPQLANVAVTLTPPAYTKLAPIELQTLGLTALPGSTLKYRIGFDLDHGRTVEQTGVALDGEALMVERTEQGLIGSLTVRKGGTLVVGMQDQDHIGPNPEPRFTLTLAEDRKPLVSLAGPKAKETVTVRARVRLGVEASDDYGLASLDLRARTFAEAPAGGERATAEAKPAKEQLTPFADVAGQAATTRQGLVVVADLAKDGERIVLVGLASDANDITGPGKGESQPVELKVVSETELRQEFDRLLGEARDRVVQARDEIGQGLAKPDKLTLASRSAAMSSTRAGDLLSQVVRRWKENQLPDDQGMPIAKAEEFVNRQAFIALAQASRGDEPPARLADRHLAEAEQLLASLLQEGDLTRVLATLIERQRSLGEETRAFVREHLTKPIDDAAKARQTNLAQRQQELADQVKDLERRVLASPSPQLEQARELLRSETPADQLQQAGKEVGSEKERTQSVPRQEKALKTMEKLLEQLRGNDAAKDLAKKAGELAARQEDLLRRLAEGEEPKQLEKDQDQLKKETEQFGKQLDKQPEAQKKVGAAAQSQGGASQAMQKSDRSGAEREGSAAADLLREAQKQLEPPPQKQDEDKDKDKDKRSPDVMKLLKELRKQQLALVTDSTLIHQRIGDEPLDFAASREVPVLAERESDILLRLREEGMKEIEQMPIALVALQRVAVALERTAQHLATPALGERGMRLEKISLFELSRLIEIVDTMPQPEQQEKGGPPPPGGQKGNQPPFPPAAQLALLAAAQDELSVLTAANRPVDLPVMQAELKVLVGTLLEASRPGSRASLLLSRAARAMTSATELLHEHDRGATTRHEQAAATAALRRLIAEAKGQSGSSGSSSQAQNQQRNQGQPPPAGGKQPGQSQ
ncbi:MAG TPA: hypothetical protein VHX44_11110, partial [Planctomycetota bacterium]|nr:hypothetical protein [Planctomycetota bacterium]